MFYWFHCDNVDCNVEIFKDMFCCPNCTLLGTILDKAEVNYNKNGPTAYYKVAIFRVS